MRAEPIKAGDTCQVVAGLGQQKSPNIGLTVKVVALSGEHSRLGRVWRCEGAHIKQLTDSGAYVEVGWADFPTSWLSKLPPPPAGGVTSSVKESVTA